MQRADALVALVGGIILAIGIGGAALTGGALGGAAYRVEFAEAPLAPVALDLGDGQLVSSFQDDGEFTLDGNLTRLDVTVWLNATAAALPPGSTLHVTLMAPNGTAYEAEATGATGGTSLSVKLQVPLSDVPAARDVAAATGDEAVRAAAPQGNATGAGAWRVHFDYSTGSPALAPRVSAALLAEPTGWTASAAPATGGR